MTLTFEFLLLRLKNDNDKKKAGKTVLCYTKAFYRLRNSFVYFCKILKM